MKRALMALIVVAALYTVGVGAATTAPSSADTTDRGTTADAVGSTNDIGTMAHCTANYCCINTDDDPEFEQCWRR